MAFFLTSLINDKEWIVVMKVAFFSNYLNHHQLAFCFAMNRLTENQFCFVAFMPTPAFRLELGYQEMNDKYPFVLKAYESEEKKAEAMAIAMDYDIVIFGSTPYFFVERRIDKNLLSFWCSERIFKKNILQAFSPRGFYKRMMKSRRIKNKNIFLLSASAYAPIDHLLTGAYWGKAYKWGYFPQFEQYDTDELWKNKKKGSILWVGRLIGLKHPETAIIVAEMLKNADVPFELSIIGSGMMEPELQQMIKDKRLSDSVQIKGKMSPDEVRKYMNKTMVLLITSDYNEGWGAVLNEGMNSSCAVVASQAIGSAAYLIENNINGMYYHFGNNKQLFKCIKGLLEQPEKCKEMGENAYKTIRDKWNADIAAERLLRISMDLSNSGKSERYIDGPCSRARIMEKWWRKN